MFSFVINTAVIEVSDSGNPGLGDYGNVAGPLTNGTRFYTRVDGVETLRGQDMNSNRTLSNLGPFVQQQDFSASNAISIYTFDFLQHSPKGFLLQVKKGDRMGFKVRDNLSTLVAHNLALKGYLFLEE